MTAISENIFTAKQASVAVVILNWNGRSYLEKYLPSVLASSYSEKRVIVADNGSTDDSVSFLRTNFPEVEIIINPSNEGFAKGYNTALKQVQADYFVLLNSDVEVTKGWIEPVIELMEKDLSVSACQPKLLDEKNKIKFEYAGAAGGWIDALGYPFARGRVLENMEEDKGQYNDIQQCFWATGAAMFVRASVYQLLGGLDEYFFAHQEEIDLCWRMQKAGGKIFAVPASVVYHVGGGTLPKGNSRKVYLNFRNNLIMVFKNMPASALVWKLPVRIGLDWLAALKGLAGGDFGYPVAVLKAHLHFVKWIFVHRKHSLFVKQNHRISAGKYSGSILWNYYFRNRKTFSEIIKRK